MKDDKRFPQFLEYKDKYYSIKGYIEDTKTDEFKEGKGYISKEDGKIWIYTEKKNLTSVPFIRLEITGEGDNIKKEINKYNRTSNNDEIFSEENLVDISYKKIEEKSDVNDVLYDARALEDMNAATSKYVPEIKEDDDPLKKLIKKSILEKDININRLKCKLGNKYVLTNMRQALTGNTKMSIPNFKIWCELLGLHFRFEIWDNDTDNIDPLNGKIVFDSTSGLSVEEDK